MMSKYFIILQALIMKRKLFLESMMKENLLCMEMYMKKMIGIFLIYCLSIQVINANDILIDSLFQLNQLLVNLDQALQRAGHRQPSQPVFPEPQRIPQNFISTARPGETIERGKFVEDILGMGEEQFRNQYGWSNTGLERPQANGRLTKFPQDVMAWIKEYPRRAAIFQGELVYGTNQQLLQEIQKQQPQAQFRYQPRFILRIHDPEFSNPTDIRYLQADPHNRYTSFQIASTFFGPLEGSIIKFDNSLGITRSGLGMFYGAAQGEEASISSGGATIYRKYIMPTQRIAEGNSFGYFYLLHDIKSGNREKLPWDIYRHAADIDRNAAQNYQPATIRNNPQLFQDDVNHVGIGNHKYVVVTSGGGTFHGNKPAATDRQARLDVVIYPDTGRVNPEQTQLVHQIFTAAYSLRGGRSNQNQKSLARMVLQGSYIGTVRAAYLNAKETGVNNLFLTLMGAGAFANPIDWVGDAIKRVKDEIRNYQLQTFLIYRSDAHKKHRKAESDKQFILDMIQIMDEINGTNLMNNQQLLGHIDGYIDASFTNKNSQSEARYANAINRILDPYYHVKIAKEHEENEENEGWVVTRGRRG